MDLVRKIEIFERYDFSKHAELERAHIDWDDPRSGLYHGLASIVSGISGSVGYIAGRYCDTLEEYKVQEANIQLCYGWLQSHYQSIPWHELDRSDSDFSIFFDMKDLIDRLGNQIDIFLMITRPTFIGDVKSEEFQKFKKTIVTMGKTLPKYREIKHRLRASQPLNNNSP